MQIRRARRRAPIVPINAMSDIAFLLLIFIMLISLITYRREIPIDYPEAELTEVTQADSNFEIWIRPDGALFIDGARVTPAAVEQEIARVAAEDPTTRIHILADRATAYRHVAGVIEILQLLQYRSVSLVVREPGGSS